MGVCSKGFKMAHGLKIITVKVCSNYDEPLVLNRVAFHTKTSQLSKSYLMIAHLSIYCFAIHN